MKLMLIGVAFLEFLCVGQSFGKSPELLKVTIYYESLCPYSVGFITKDLYPAYQKIGSSLLVNFVPYGNANKTKVDGKWTFHCQHGAEECWGNKAQACGLAENKGQNKTVVYINCMMDHDDPASKEAVNKCAPKLGVTAQSILNCITERGDELLAQLGDEQKVDDDNISGVPTISFNDNYDEKLDNEASENFLQTACNLLSNTPENCPASEGNALDED